LKIAMESKRAKTPPISKDTKLLSFDLEANGLHGEVFAVGALVIDMQGKVLDQFTGRTKIVGQVDPWVEKNVLPSLGDMPLTHKTYRDLREAFWRWYLATESESDYVIVSNGYPVEYRFLLKCQDENLPERYWQHPFPILDLTSMLIQAGSETAKRASHEASQAISGFARHNPLDDAKLAVFTACKLFQITGKL
jgi:hypothetical protein